MHLESFLLLVIRILHFCANKLYVAFEKLVPMQQMTANATSTYCNELFKKKLINSKSDFGKCPFHVVVLTGLNGFINAVVAVV